jgi:protein SCO1/2
MRRGLLLLLLPGVWLGGVACAAADVAKKNEELRIEQRLGKQVPLQLTFRDEQGRRVHLEDFVGSKPVVLVLAYYRCPALCSRVLNSLEESLSRIPLNAGKDFQVVIVSFDPNETPALAAANKKVCLEHYDRPGAEDGWHFLTGTEANIRPLADAVGFRYKRDPRTGQYKHAAGIMLLTPDGKVARYYMGIIYPVRDLRLGLVETAGGKIGSPVDNALLLTCLAFDPSTGRYSVAVLKLIQTGGVITVLLLGCYVGWHWLRGGIYTIYIKAHKLLGCYVGWHWLRGRRTRSLGALETAKVPRPELGNEE